MDTKQISQDELRRIAEAACRKSNGSGWDTMAAVDQESQIESWMEGYCVGSGKPYFRITGQGWGGGWEAGETIVLPDPRVQWLQEVFADFSENHWAVADADEVEHFVKWVAEKFEKKLTGHHVK